MNRLNQLIRIATPLALTFMLGVAWITAGPNLLRAQARKLDCIDNRELLGPCVELAYRYEGDCEGFGCLSRDEMCCLDEIFVIVRR